MPYLQCCDTASRAVLAGLSSVCPPSFRLECRGASSSSFHLPAVSLENPELVCSDRGHMPQTMLNRSDG